MENNEEIKTPKFKKGQLVKLSKDFIDENIHLKKGWSVYISDIESNGEYLCECIEYGFYCSEDFLKD